MGSNVKTSGQLTEREQAILDHLSGGLSDQQIANELFLSLEVLAEKGM